MTTLVIAEHDNNELKPATLHVVAAAAQLGGGFDILVAGENCAAVGEQAAAVEGVGKVLVADDAAYANQLAENIAPLVGYLASPAAQNISGNVFIVWGKEIAVLESTKRAGEFQAGDEGWNHDAVAEKLNAFFDGKEPIKDSFIVSPFE